MQVERSITLEEGACTGILVVLSGGRVSNRWIICPSLRDNSQKWLLIPHKLTLSHGRVRKDLSVKEESALD